MEEIREGLRLMVSQSDGFSCLSVYDKAEDAFTGLSAEPADIVIMDISLPGMTGIECIHRLKAVNASMEFIIFTIYEDSDQVFEALAAGASGYLLKDTPPDKIMAALKELHEGGAPMSTSIARKVVASFRESDERSKLSNREMEILNLLAKGFLYKEIAARLFITTGTVRQHIHNIYEKLHVQNRTEAINKVFGKR